MIFFTADTHFGHANVIKYSNRPFKDVHEMNETLINNWNAVVHPNDIVYHLGDVCLMPLEQANAIVKKLNGKKYLVLGNHDRKLRKTIFKSNFQGIADIMELIVPDSDAPRGKQLIIMCHYAMRTWNKSHYGSWQLYGHSHGKLTEAPHMLSVDVGVDGMSQYSPISYEQVKQFMKSKIVKLVDKCDNLG